MNRIGDLLRTETIHFVQCFFFQRSNDTKSKYWPKWLRRWRRTRRQKPISCHHSDGSVPFLLLDAASVRQWFIIKCRLNWYNLFTERPPRGVHCSFLTLFFTFTLISSFPKCAVCIFTSAMAEKGERLMFKNAVKRSCVFPSRLLACEATKKYRKYKYDHQWNLNWFNLRYSVFRVFEMCFTVPRHLWEEEKGLHDVNEKSRSPFFHRKKIKWRYYGDIKIS